MSLPVAKVAFITGQVWAKSPDGSLRVLKPGDLVNADDVVITSADARVELDFGNGPAITIAGGQEVAMGQDLWEVTATDASDAALSDASIQQALTILEQGGDLTEDLEETAAGGGESTGGGSNSFVQVGRVNTDSADDQQFNYSTGNPEGSFTSVDDASPVNQAPVTGELLFNVDEDTVLTGRVIATDIENDSLSYTLVTAPIHGAITFDASTGEFVYVPTANYAGPDSFIVSISDGRNTTTSTVNLNVVAVNDAPTSGDLGLQTDEDTPVSGQILADDIEGDLLAYVLSGSPAHGSVVLDATTGAFTYTPNPDYNGSDSFVVAIDDGQGGITSSTVTIGINPVNDAPVTRDLTLVTDEDVPVTGQVIATDADADTLTYALATTAAHGAVVLDSATGQFTYTPNADFNGSDSFSVTIDDGYGGTTTSWIIVNVTPVNDAPLTADLSLLTREDIPVSGQVLATDIDGDTLGYVLGVAPQNGNVTLNPATGEFTYQPNPNFYGSDSFVITVDDGNGGTATSRVNIGVASDNNAPVTANINLTTEEDTAVVGQVTATDIDGEILAYSLGTSAAHGTVTLNPATGQFTYTPSADYNGSDSFVVRVSDGSGGTALSTVFIEVTPVNDAPVAVDDSFNVAQNIPLVIAPSTLLGNDIDVDGDTLSVFSVQNEVNGSLTFVGGNLVFTPTANFTGTASFDYTVADGNGGYDSATVTITVNPLIPVNAPTIMNPEVLSLDEDSSIIGNVLTNDSDPDDVLEITGYEINGTSFVLGVTSALPGVGSFVLSANGDFEFIGAPDYYGPVPVVTYTTNTGASSTLKLTVDSVNDAPDAVDDSFSINANTSLVIAPSALLANDADVDFDVLVLDSTSNAVNGSVSVVDGDLVFTPTAGFSGQASFQYLVSDNNGGYDTATVLINVNAAPETDNISASGDEDTVVTVVLSGSDSDGTVSGYVINTLPVNGVLYSDAALTQSVVAGELVTGPLFFQPTADWNGSTSFTYSALDNQGFADSSPATATIIVNPLNDAAVLSAGSGTVKEDAPAQADAGGILTVVDIDDGDAGFQSQVNVPGSYGFFSIDTTGNWTYSIDNANAAVQALKEGELRTEVFTVKSIDGTETSVTVTVEGTNDIPVARADVAITDLRTPITIAVLGNDTDLDSDTLTVTDAIVDPSAGTVVINPDGTLTFTPIGVTPGSVTIAYTISDNNGGTATSTVDVTVTSVNHAPVAADDVGTVSSSYTVNLGIGAPKSWGATDSNGMAISMIAYRSDGTVGSFYRNTSTHQLGVSGTLREGSEAGQEPNQIEYHRLTNQSESILINLNGNLVSASFSVTNLVADEAGGEVGLWTAYYQGIEVASQSFRLTTGDAGTFGITANGLVFDSVRFSALHTVNGTGDGGGYFLTSFSGSGPASANGAYTLAENGTLTINAASPHNLLANDSDADNDALSITHINGVAITDGQLITLGSGALLTIHTNGSFSYSPNGQFNGLSQGQLGSDSFTYSIADGKGGTATATATMTLIGMDVAAQEISGTTGSDTLVGTLGADTFVWNLHHQGVAGAPVVDTVVGFNGAQGDVLDLRDLLQGETNATLGNFLHVSSNGTDTTIHVSSSGGYSSGAYNAAQTDQVILLQNVHVSGGDSADMITQLKNAGQLLTD